MLSTGIGRAAVPQDCAVRQAFDELLHGALQAAVLAPHYDSIYMQHILVSNKMLTRKLPQLSAAVRLHPGFRRAAA